MGHSPWKDYTVRTEVVTEYAYSVKARSREEAREKIKAALNAERNEYGEGSADQWDRGEHITSIQVED